MAYNFKLPTSCLNCRSCGNYTEEVDGSPRVHYSCDLIYQLYGIRYDVLPNIVDPSCPYRDKDFVQGVTRTSYKI